MTYSPFHLFFNQKNKNSNWHFFSVSAEQLLMKLNIYKGSFQSVPWLLFIPFLSLSLQSKFFFFLLLFIYTNWEELVLHCLIFIVLSTKHEKTSSRSKGTAPSFTSWLLMWIFFCRKSVFLCFLLTIFYLCATSDTQSYNTPMHHVWERRLKLKNV